MEFGKVSPHKLPSIDFSLPEDPAQNQEVLGGKPARNLEVLVGCPVWANANWVGETYPPRSNSAQYLEAYGKQFNTIELNSSHYHTPSLDTLAKWHQQVPPNFRFAPKIPQQISHQLVGKGKAQTAIWAFYEQMSHL